MCNQAKDDQWDDGNPILDGADDDIIEHLSYRLGGGATRWAESHRGATTIKHAELNRQRLVDARTEIAHRILDMIQNLNKAPKAPASAQVRAELEKKTAGEYGSLVGWLLTAFLCD